MVMKCEEMWPEISNYVDGEVSAALKLAMDEHLAGCRQCQSVVSGTRNVVRLYGDEKAFALPANFYPELHSGLVERVEGVRGQGGAWVLAIAAAILLTATVLVAQVRDRGTPQLRAAMARPLTEKVKGMVVVADDTKVFHVAGCEYIHGTPHTISAENAIQAGYTPCVRCLRELYEKSAWRSATKDNDVTSKDPAMILDSTDGGD